MTISELPEPELTETELDRIEKWESEGKGRSFFGLLMSFAGDGAPKTSDIRSLLSALYPERTFTTPAEIMAAFSQLMGPLGKAVTDMGL